MSQPRLEFFCPAGFGSELAAKQLNYSSAVRVGDRIEISGQGGWDAKATTYETLNIPENDLEAEIAQAFANIDYVLKEAGGKGWSQVYRVNSYHTELNADVTKLMSDQYRKWMPGHMPIWTEIGVKALGSPMMHVEIEVVAYDPK